MAAVWAILWATAMLSSGQQPGASSEVAARIRLVESTRFEAQRSKDAHTLDALLDNAVVWVDPDGAQQTKSDYLAKLRLRGASVFDITPVSMTVHVVGSIAIVFGVYREKGIRDGRPYQQRARFIDTWVFKNGNWVCIAAVASAAIS
jgi:ketosteroid isomerase-like protein